MGTSHIADGGDGFNQVAILAAQECQLHSIRETIDMTTQSFHNLPRHRSFRIDENCREPA